MQKRPYPAFATNAEWQKKTVETQNLASPPNKQIERRKILRLYKTNRIYCITVTRFTATPFSVATRTTYMPALNWAMFKVYSSPATLAS